MAVIRIAGFQGAVLAINPKLLQDVAAVKSLNHDPLHADLRPLAAPLQVASVTAGSASIYRMNRDQASDTQYWLAWASKVHAVRGFIGTDTSERTYYTGDGPPKWTNLQLATSSSPYPGAWRLLGIPAPVSPPNTSATGGTTTGTLEQRAYVYTYVNSVGDEGPPSPPSAMLTCPFDATVTVTNIQPPPAGEYDINRIRIYRTQAGSASAGYFFLGEVLSTATTFSDAALPIQEILTSAGGFAPPSDLHHLTPMWNGMLAGISGRSVRDCSAYKAYAWPIDYDTTLADFSPVALATIGQNLLILTTGTPLLVSGGSPDALDQTPVAFPHSCASDLSVVSFGHGAVWASPDGLAYYGTGGAEGATVYAGGMAGAMLTERLMTREQWQALNPASMVGVRWLNYYVAFYRVGGVWNGLMIDPRNPNGGVYFLDFGYPAVWRDELSEQVYVLSANGAISKWNSGAALSVTFRSKVFRQPSPGPLFAYGEVIADSYPVRMRVWADGVLKFDADVTSRDSFRLPSGFIANDFQIEIVSSVPVVAVTLAHSAEEIALT